MFEIRHKRTREVLASIDADSLVGRKISGAGCGGPIWRASIFPAPT